MERQRPFLRALDNMLVRNHKSHLSFMIEMMSIQKCSPGPLYAIIIFGIDTYG